MYHQAARRDRECAFAISTAPGGWPRHVHVPISTLSRCPPSLLFMPLCLLPACTLPFRYNFRDARTPVGASRVRTTLQFTNGTEMDTVSYWKIEFYCEWCVYDRCPHHALDSPRTKAVIRTTDSTVLPHRRLFPLVGRYREETFFSPADESTYFLIAEVE